MGALESFFMQLAKTDKIRNDLLAVLGFGKEPATGDEAMNLFWELWKPEALITSVTPFELVEEKEPLPSDVEEGLLEKLAEFEHAERLPSGPDLDISGWNSFDYAHVAAARAFRMKRKEGYSEEVRRCLEGAWRAACLYDVALTHFQWYPEAPAQIISMWAISGLVLMELFRIKRLEGGYEEALHLLAQGLQFYGSAVESNEVPVDQVVRESGFDEEIANEERRLRPILEDKLSAVEVDAQEAANVFECLRSLGKVDWRQVAKDCKALAEYWSLCLRDDEEPISDSQGNSKPWFQFWLVAQGFAEEKLTPDEIRDLFREKEDEEAEKRLRAYFFCGPLWDEMPERAKRALITAERIWFSTQAGRVEASLNELRVATESLCFSFIWEPLREWKGGQSFLEFVKKDNELKERRHDPTLSDYAWACRRPFFKEFIASLKVEEEQQGFLTSELPASLKELSEIRNPAEHHSTRKWNREKEVTPTVKKFLGIGYRGILPRLVEIGEKLSPSKKPIKGIQRP